MDNDTYQRIFGDPWLSKEEIKLITKIAARYCAKLMEMDAPPRDQQDVVMDITAVHHQCPLKLEQLLHTDDFNFIHDVAGIEYHLNRETGKLENCFVPRYAKGIKDMTEEELERIAADEDNPEYESAIEELDLRNEHDDRVRQAQGLPTKDASGMQPS